MASIENPQLINIQFNTDKQAYNYFGKVEAGCAAVNQNDYLGDIFIYNAKALGADLTGT
jgi:hypothetical protein